MRYLRRWPVALVAARSTALITAMLIVIYVVLPAALGVAGARVPG